MCWVGFLNTPVHARHQPGAHVHGSAQHRGFEGLLARCVVFGVEAKTGAEGVALVDGVDTDQAAFVAHGTGAKGVHQGGVPGAFDDAVLQSPVGADVDGGGCGGNLAG